MDEQKDSEQEWNERWRIAFGIALIIGIADVSVLFLGNANKSFTSWSVGTVGIITFLGVLMLVNYLSKDPNVTKGEVRKAIAASCIAVYFVLVSLLAFSGSNLSDTVAETVIKCFTCIIGIIIVFYFGSRSVEEYMKLKGKQAKYEQEEKEPEPNKETQSNASNNKGSIRKNQDAGLDQITRIEQKMESLSFVNYLSVVGGFTATAGVALLATWIGMAPSPTLGSSKIEYILFFSGLVLLIFGVCMIRNAHDMYPPELSSKEKELIYKNLLCAIIIAVCVSVSIVLILSLLNLIYSSFVYITNCLF